MATERFERKRIIFLLFSSLKNPPGFSSRNLYSARSFIILQENLIYMVTFAIVLSVLVLVLLIVYIRSNRKPVKNKIDNGKSTEIKKEKNAIDSFNQSRYPSLKRFLAIYYSGGHPELPTPGNILIEVIPEIKSINLAVPENWKLKRIQIESKDIIDISFEQKSQRSVGKAATGAIVGGLLTGGIGLIAGAALGASKKNKSTLYITHKYKDREFNIVLETGKKTQEVYSAIISLFN